MRDDEKGTNIIQSEKINDLPPMEVGHMLLFKSYEASVEGPVFYIKETNNNISNIIKESSLI